MRLNDALSADERDMKLKRIRLMEFHLTHCSEMYTSQLTTLSIRLVDPVYSFVSFVYGIRGRIYLLEK